ncbi:hypothetical protein SAMN05216499_1491 [Actinacidiphila paucisporea]|uniref:Uncharacterized protein n=1 Tax=Actinacidiphila paucisporea TaxID=310782 RepID=A0A1M7QY03_9ACTN|nr:hypothetical protein SAMN05216499_1491 [Actinacidiphila paucisporea]
MTSIELNGFAEPDALPGLALRWFEAVTGGLLADVVGGLRDGEVALPRSRPGVGSEPWGAPGTMWASLTRYGSAAGRVTSRRAWSARGWSTFLKGFAKFPAGVGMDIVELDATGYPRFGDRASIVLRTVNDERRWFRMVCEFGAFPEGPKNRIARLTEEDARDLAWEMAQEMPVTYGGVGDDGRHWGPTMLEDRLAREARVGVTESREVLRGYPWVTVCAPEIAARLGGPDALRASGAFHEVRVLPTGSVWLQATEHLDDYTGDALRRVFETVAPVLPPGEPRTYLGKELGRIIYADASAYQQR